MKLGKIGQGAIDVGTILGIIGVMVAVIIGALVYTKVSDQMGNLVSADSMGENVKENVDEVSGTIFTLLPILVLVAVVLSLFMIFRPGT